jgi:hypothetical protein
MHQQSTATPASSSVTWDSLEAWVRERIQGFIQDLVEEEVTELLGVVPTRVGMDRSGPKHLSPSADVDAPSPCRPPASERTHP